MKKVIQIQGLDCAVCAAELEREIAKLDGVKSANLTYVNQKLTVEYNNDRVLDKIIATINNFEEARVVENGEVQEVSHKKSWIMIAVSAIFLLFGILLKSIFQKLSGVIVANLFYTVAYVTVGYPVLKVTGKNIVKGKIFDENFLMALASVGAMFIGEMEEAVLVMLLYQMGETLQQIAVGASRRSIADLMQLKSDVAILLKNGEQIEVSPETLQIGDTIIIRNGDKVPIDGVLLNEEAILDTKSLTGESEYKRVSKGEEILSGCINVGGMYEMKVIRLYKNSAVSKILDMVENATSRKADSEKFITKFAKYYTPIVCGLAVFIAVIVPLFNGLIAGEGFYFKEWERWLQSALTFLVISCPCALVISVPLTYFSGIGECAKRGILVKGATYLDIASRVNIFAFDKTGTLTQGNFAVCGTYTTKEGKEEMLLNIATALEKGSAHPIAKAFSSLSTTLKAENIQEKAGKGLVGEINGEKYLIGTSVLLKENAVHTEKEDGPFTFLHLAREKEYLGYIKIGDVVRKEAKQTVEMLKQMGFQRFVMLTGDNEERAYKIANEVGVYELNCKLLPDEKLGRAYELMKEGTLLYVGDGINDAPIMSVADCAVSMGSLGSSVAVEASDFVLVSDNLKALPVLIHISKKTKRIVVENILFSIAMKIVFMMLGLFGILPLWLAVFADVGVMLLAVANSFRVRIHKKQ